MKPQQTYLANGKMPISELESSMNKVQVDQKIYQMPPKEVFTVAHCITVADIERSARILETVSEVV